MNLDDLKDRITSDAQQTWERIQDSAAFNQLRDRYENLTPTMQKLTVVAASAAVTLFVLSFPYGSLTTSKEYVSEFESKRDTIRELLKVSRESADVPEIPTAPSASSLQATIENQIRSANLLPEQIKGIQIMESNSSLIPKNLTESLVQVSLAKLNLRQILDLGHQFQSISSSAKMKGLVINANREDTRYFDAVYRLVTLAVPAPPEPALESPAAGGRRGRSGGGDQ